LVAAAPLSLLPRWLADAVFFAISVLAAVAALRLLGVRDWRCAAVACISWPIVFGAWLGNISLLVLFGVALVWRWRATIWPAASAVASVVCAKLFMWPLGIWLLITRRFRVLALATLVGLAAGAAGWAVIGFNHLREYPRLLLNIITIGEGRGSSLVSTLMSLGVPSSIARIVALVCASALIAIAWRLTKLPDGDRRAYGVIVISALIATPIAWAHYLALVFVPIALLSPRMSWMWFLPMLAGLEPGPVAHPVVWVSMPMLTVEFVLLCALCSPLLRLRAEAHETGEPSRAKARRAVASPDFKVDRAGVGVNG
jgi:alpha-1,2-mannosyltransferase